MKTKCLGGNRNLGSYMEMSLVEEISEEEQRLILIGNLFAGFVNKGDYLDALGYYMGLEAEYQNFIKNNIGLNALLDLAIDEAPYQKI